MKYYGFIASLAFILITVPLLSQSANGQQKNYRSQSEILSGWLDPVFGPSETLVTGPFYYGPRRGSINGHPFYIDDTWKKGSVEIGNQRFEGLDLKYDILINQFVLRYTTSNNSLTQVGLRPGGITKIGMNHRVFVPFTGKGDTTATLFAELAAEGTINFLVVKKKYIILATGSSRYTFEYKNNIQQYLEIDGTLTPFRGRSTLLRVFPEHKSSLNRYARSEKLKLSKKNIDDRAAWITYCNQLLNQPDE